MPQFIQDLISAVGSHGVFAILGTIVLVRLVLAGRYLTKKQAILTMVGISIPMGIGSVVAIAKSLEYLDLFAGAFITPIGTAITFELSKWLIAWRYSATKKEFWRVLFFVLSPKPLKHKEGGKETKTPPNPTLTQYMDWRPEK